MGHRPADRRPSFGRDRDREALVERLATAGAVVVTGPPGIGKSRLVGEIAATWPAEVVWVDLDGAARADEGVARVASALGVASPAAIGPALRSRGGALLVLDDAEAAAPFLPEQVAGWTAEAPALRVLASSRVRMDEAVPWLLGPLDSEAAAALYLERARSVSPGVQVDPDALADLVEALDRLPLALELAASRVRLFPPEVLHRRLPGILADPRRIGRHGSLDAALGASWELLSEAQQQGLAAATLLRGPFDAAAFERVTGCASDVLEALLDASLVDGTAPGRVRLLETVRAFAASRLDPEIRADRVSRHAAWALERGSEAVARARADGDWSEVGALRADLREVLGRGEPDAARAALLLCELALAAGPRIDPTRELGEIPEALRVRIACVRANFLLDEGRSEDALTVLADPGTPQDATERLLLAWQRMVHLRHLNRPEAALAALAEAERAAPDAAPYEVASFRIAESVLHAWRSDRERAVAALEAGRRALVPAPSRGLDARLRAYLGGVLSRETETRALGIAHLEHALALFRQLGDRGWEGVVLVWLGGTLFDAGALPLAAGHLERAAEVCARSGDTRFETQALEHLAGVRIEQRRWDDVEALHARIRTLPPRPAILALLHGQSGLVAHFSGRTGEARAHYAAAIAGFAAQGHRALQVTYRVFLALVAPEQAGELLARAEASGLEGHQVLLVRIARDAVGGGLHEDTRTMAAGVERADVRIALALTEGRAQVAADGSWFARRGGEQVDLSRRVVLRRALGALAAAGAGAWVGRDALVEATWPGERMTRPSADGRLHAAVRTLRKLGLDGVLRTGERDGELAYGLVEDVQVLG